MKGSVVNILIILLNLSILVNLTAGKGGWFRSSGSSTIGVADDDESDENSDAEETPDNDAATNVQKDLGISSCRYSGSYDSYNDKCHKDKVKVRKLPKECTAYIYDGITCQDDGMNNNYPTYIPTDFDTFQSLVEFKQNVHIMYGYPDIQAWFKAVNPQKSIVEALTAKKFCDYFSVAGLILKGIYYNYNLPLDYHVPDDFSINLRTYIETMKYEMPNLKIGLYLNATSVIFYSNNSMSPDWFDFGVLNDVLDYYVVGFEDFNECTNDLLFGGVTPMDSLDPNINTLNKFGAALSMSNIPKEKLYLEYIINPTLKKEDETKFMKCEISYGKYCEKGYKYTWCADNDKTFFAKGQFAKEYANGFVARDIDLVDRDLHCKCDEDKFITFHMVLNGYTGLGMKTCGRIDGS